MQPGRTYLPAASIVRSAATASFGADECDALAFDEDVGDVVVGGGDDAPSADKSRHRLRV